MKKFASSNSYDFSLKPELKKDLFIENFDEKKNHPLKMGIPINYEKEIFRNACQTVKNEKKGYFFENEREKEDQKHVFPLAQGYHKQPLQKIPNFDKKNSFSFYEGSKSQENFFSQKKAEAIRNNILKKYEVDKANLEDISEEKEKKEKKIFNREEKIFENSFKKGDNLLKKIEHKAESIQQRLQFEQILRK